MIYVHVPFCKSFCVYCDFYSELDCGDASVIRNYSLQLQKEARERREEILESAETNTLYIGGGTPSLTPLPFFEDLLKTLPLSGFEEFTVEVNPDDVLKRGKDFLIPLKDLGVNRISMGVQSLSDKTLSWMGRRHDADCALKAYELLRDCGFDNISLDLIFGIDGDQDFEKSLNGFIRLHPEHISAYQLSIEEGSALHSKLEKGLYTPLSDEKCSEQYYLICEKLKASGYSHYEISNWALPGKEAIHNSAYWSRKPYVGLGPGAHSLRFCPDNQQLRSWNSNNIREWSSESEKLSDEEIREEIIMLGLRRKEGVDVDGRHLQIPEEKWFIADSIIAELI
ncbi:MAG: radical SAM family heme chaperone HemW [Candidatus Cryptobacteroides sp.]